MKLLKPLLLLVLLLFIPQITNAQISLNGTITDQQEEALPFASIIVYQSEDSTMIKGIVTDIHGYYSMPVNHTGNYYLTVHMIGYTDITESFTASQGKDITLNFVLEEAIEQLDDVVIKGQKPLYEKSGDRTIVNVQSSITSKGKSVLQVLAKSPGVTVNQQNGAISLYGKNGVLVMINGKMSRLPMEAIVQMLDGMNASNVEKIELITNPPASYDAEGNAGVINITTIKQADMGTQGNLGVTLGYNQAETYGANVNLNHRSKNVNLLFEYSRLTDQNIQTWQDNRVIFGDPFDQSILSNQYREPKMTSQNLRMGGEWNISSKLAFNLLFTGYKSNWDMDGITNTSNFINPDSSLNTNMDLHESNVWKHGSISAGLIYQLSKNQKLSLNVDYMKYKNENPSNYDITETIQALEPTSKYLGVTKNTPISFKIGSVDYQNSISENFEFSLGTKFTTSNFDNKVVVRETAGGQTNVIDRFSSISALEEAIWAGYASWKWKASTNLSIQGGLRYEYTDTYLSTPEDIGIIDRTYGNFFPNLSISRALKENKSLNFAYSKRITRPTFNEMAPFVFFTGPGSFFAGNPGLQPSINDAVDVSYSAPKFWISVKYSKSKNAIGDKQPFLDTETSEQIFKPVNLKKLNVGSITSNYSTTITNWWEIQAEASVYYQTMETSYFDLNYQQNNVYFSIASTSTFLLPKDYSIELSGNYLSHQYWGIWEFDAFGQLDIGFRKSIGKGTLSLVFSDLLHTYIWKSDIILPDAKSSAAWDYDWNNRAVTLSYTMSLGKKSVKNVQLNTGNREEKNRVN